MAGELLYDPNKLGALHRKTAEAVRYLDETGCDDPMAATAIATVRATSFTLSTLWAPWFARVLGDRSMIDWDTPGPVGAGIGVHGTESRSFPTAPSPNVNGQIVGEMTELTEEVLAGDNSSSANSALSRLDELIAEHGDEPGLMAAYFTALGTDRLAELSAHLEDPDNFPLIVLMPAVNEARQRVLFALPGGNPFQFPPPSGNFSLAESVVTEEGRDWQHDVDPDCVGLDYRGGGYVEGADGRMYPIVIPWIETEDGVFTADLGVPPNENTVTNLDGSDGRWEVVDYECGVERFQEAPDLGEYVLPFLLHGTAAQLTPVPPDSGLAYVAMSPFFPPTFSTAPARRPASVPPGDPVADPTGASPSAVVGAGADALALATESALVAVNMDNGNQRAYQVVFEENVDDHRIRARIETYTLCYDGNGDVVIVPENVFVDNEDGSLMSTTVSYRPRSPDTPGGVSPPDVRDVADLAFSGAPITYEITEATFP